MKQERIGTMGASNGRIGLSAVEVFVLRAMAEDEALPSVQGRLDRSEEGQYGGFGRDAAVNISRKLKKRFGVGTAHGLIHRAHQEGFLS